MSNKCVICGKDSGKGQTCSPAHRKALQRRNASVTNVTVKECDKLSVTGVMTPEGLKSEVPANYGQPDCECRHCQQTKVRRERGLVLNHGKYKMMNELDADEINRVSLPGDVDYHAMPIRFSQVVEAKSITLANGSEIVGVSVEDVSDEALVEAK